MLLERNAIDSIAFFLSVQSMRFIPGKSIIKSGIHFNMNFNKLFSNIFTNVIIFIYVITILKNSKIY